MKGNIQIIIAIIVGALIIGGAIIYSGKNPNPEQKPSPEQEDEVQEVSISDVTEADHIRGSIDAPIKVIEYSDLECPFCKRYQTTMKSLYEEYDGQVAWVYRHLPLTEIHEKAVTESLASECVAELAGNDAFWSFIDSIYEISPGNDGLDLAKLPELAKSVGVDEAKFDECMKSGRHIDKIMAQRDEAVASGGTGTPFSVVIDKKGTKTPVVGAQPYEAFKSLFDAMLAQE